nr:hypothetical protein [Xylella fastidiosa]
MHRLIRAIKIRLTKPEADNLPHRSPAPAYRFGQKNNSADKLLVVWNAPSVQQIKLRWRQPDGGDVDAFISIAGDEGISGVTQGSGANVQALTGGDGGGVGLGLEGEVVAVEVPSAKVVDDAAIGQGIGGGELGTAADHFQVTMKLGRSLAVDFIEDDLGGGDASDAHPAEAEPEAKDDGMWSARWELRCRSRTCGTAGCGGKC